MRTNCLLSDFLFSECSTLSHLFNTYCVNIYGTPLWKYYDKKLLELFYVTWKKSMRRVWNISNVTHNNLLPYIHNCHPIEVILEKRCIKFVWSLFNSNYALYSNILRLSLQNGNSTMGDISHISCINRRAKLGQIQGGLPLKKIHIYEFLCYKKSNF